MSNNPFAPDRRICRRPNGFTLVEVLVVIAIILILSGIVVGVAGGIQNKQAATRAKGEIATLAGALESYKLKYGDYPWTSNAEELYQHLTGEIKMVPGENPGQVETPTVPEANRRPFVDPESFSVVSGRFTDPWGNAYVYQYSSRDSGWRYGGFILYSMGPDGKKSGNISNGQIPQDYFELGDGENADNIFHGLQY